ncbi:MAG: nucleoside kinase [Bacilli bacterium]
MDTVKITFNDDTIHTYQIGTTFYDISKDFSMPSKILGVRINNEIYSLNKKALKDEVVEFFNVNDLIGNKMYKSALKFIFEVALVNKFPLATVSFEHSVPRGMLASINDKKMLTQNDISDLKGEMAKLINEDVRIEKLNVQPKEAIKYYLSIREFEKADNVQNINDKIVTLYKLKNKMNYFYSEMPYSTGAIEKFDLVYLGNNRIIFLYPGINGTPSVPEYVHYDNIIKSFLKGKEWLEMMHMPYITNLNKSVSNGSIKSFIKSSELMLSLYIANASNEISKNNDIKFVMIAGPSSSGKTTTCARLSAYLSTMGYDPISISVDDYFVDREKSPKDEFGNYDFECLLAIDVELFNTDLMKLLNNEEICLPRYNFITGKREISRKKIKMKENSILLIEGLHALNDDLTPAIDNKNKYKIYLSPFIPLNIDRHNYISTLDLRLLRRIVRDNRTRGYDVKTTIDKWQSVRSGEEKYVFPYIHQANVIINTALPYEVGVMKVFVEPLLYSVSVNSKYYEEARRLLDFLKQFYPIPGEYVNDESILREFIGGKNND